MSRVILSTPRKDGYRMPGEFEHHCGCWLLWPERSDNWRMGAKPAQKTFAEVAAKIAQFEPVTMCVSAGQYQNARRLLPEHIRVVEMSSNDAWMRDCGPTFVTNGQATRAINWQFNAWGGLNGGLYFPWHLDDQIPVKVAEIEKVDIYQAPFVLEGGSIHVDGQGTLITTEECLLNPNRNPSLTRLELEILLKEYLNVEKIIWLEKGVYQDETSGHVDNLVSFIRPGVVVLTWTDDQNDPQYEISVNAYERLIKGKDAQGRSFEVHKIHQPGPLYITKEESEGVDFLEDTLPRNEGDRLAGSYINFYLANGAVVVPVFDDPHDNEAIHILANLMPERKIIPVFAREILLGGGNIHCITQQQPG